VKLNTINFPDELLKNIRTGKLVVFAGAGVSMGAPANLPNFSELADRIAAGTGENRKKYEPDDRFLGRLYQRGVDVHVRASNLLKIKPGSSTALHSDLLRLFKDSKHIRIVTTNFDILFEDAAATLFAEPIDVYNAPALPLGHDFLGLVHVHGSLDRINGMVLTDVDFGRAYLTEGWTRRFLVDFFRNYTVLFVGYSHDDVVMHYLSRALPESEAGRRFTLIAEDMDIHEWLSRGIEPIVFKMPRKNDFSVLYGGVKQLADYVSKSLLDWRQELIALASGMPPLDEESEDQILDCLKDASKTRFFTQAAREPAWLNWLDSRKVLEPLFSNGELQEKDQILGTWMATKFALQYPHDLILLIAKHNMHLNPWFWLVLGSEIGISKDKEIEQAVLSKWVSLLLYTGQRVPDRSVLLWLSKRCAEKEDTNSILQIFTSMITNNLKVKESFFRNKGEKNYKEIRFDVEYELATDHWELKEVYTKCILPILDKVAPSLLSIAVIHLEQLHEGLASWDKSNRDRDSISYRRYAIEPHEQDNLHYATDVLINIARDSLISISKNTPELTDCWLEIISRSDAPLLRRLFIHTLDERSDITPDKKIRYLLNRIGLHDVSSHHEIYRLVANTYSELSNAVRHELIENIWAYVWPNSDDENLDVRAARVHFNWFQWLTEADTSCELAKLARDKVLVDYPDFRPREQPDLTHLHSLGWTGPSSPWTKKELLSKPVSEWVDNLLSFKGDEFLGVDRDGLVLEITKAAKENPDWGLNLTVELENRGNWKTDIWRGLIHAWEEWSSDEDLCRKFLDWLDRKELWDYYIYEITRTLSSLVLEEGKGCTVSILSDANVIATSLWFKAIEDEDYPDDSNDWLQLAINRTPGVLAEFWISSIVQWRKNQDPKPEALSEEYREALNRIVKDMSAAGGMALSVLASQLAFLLSVDYDWVIECLLPEFDPEGDSKRFQQSWNGFLTWGSLNRRVVEQLSPYFEKAITRLDRELAAQRDRFVEYFTTLVVFYIPNPLDNWIPLLFHNGQVQDWRSFSLYIEQTLRGMNEEQQSESWQRWIMQYWTNRLQGVPTQLDQVEILHMLEWLPRLSAVFPDAVEIAIQMPQVTFERLSVVYDLKDSDLVKLYPEAVVKLLIYICQSGSPRYIFYGIDKIVGMLNIDTISPDLKQKLIECMAALGLD